MSASVELLQLLLAAALVVGADVAGVLELA